MKMLPSVLPVIARLTLLVLMPAVLAIGTETVQADGARNIRRVRRQLLKPVSDDTTRNAGVFVGINKFQEGSELKTLEFAVNDAIELAHLFVFELKLIKPENCTLLISGQPNGSDVRNHLQKLIDADVRQLQARNIPILDAFEDASKVAKRKSDMLICSISSHGFDEDRNAYFMPFDSTRRRVRQTAVSLNDIQLALDDSEAGHRLLLFDACQERVAIRGGGGIPMTPAFRKRLENATGQATFASCSPGEVSRESNGLGQIGHGVFTHAVLEALRGDAPASKDNVILLGAVAEHATQRVKDWCQKAQFAPQSPSYLGSEDARNMPLAARASDQETLVANAQDEPLTSGFTTKLRDSLATELSKLDLRVERDRTFAGIVRQFFDRDVKEELFLPYLKHELTRRQTPGFQGTSFTPDADRREANKTRLARNQAFVLSVGQFRNNVAALPNVDDDLKRMRVVLRDHCGFQVSPDTVLASADAGHLRNLLGGWSNEAKFTTENAAFYFRGRLVVTDDGAVRLAAHDFVPKRPQSGSLPLTEVLAEIRNLRKVHHAVVLLDVTTDQPEDRIDTALRKAVETARDGPAVSLLVGCSFEQGAIRHRLGGSPVTKCLVAHLSTNSWKPASDSALRGPVDFDKIADDMRQKLGADGHVALVRTSDIKPGLAPVEAPKFKPRKLKLDELVVHLADVTADQLIESGIQVAVVPDFAVDAGATERELPGASCGPLLRYCMMRFKQRLCEKQSSGLRVASDVWVREVMNQHGAGPSAICRDQLKPLIESIRDRVARQSVAIIAGEIAFSGDDRLDIHCIPLSGDADSNIRTTSGTATLHSSEWAMSGLSGVNSGFLNTATSGASASSIAAEDESLRKPDHLYAPDSNVNMARILALRDSAHPLADPQFPYRVALLVNDEPEPRQPSISDDGRDAFVPLTSGDRYAIHIENRSGQPVFMRLLVDGLNTLPDYARLKLDPDDNTYFTAVKFRTGGPQSSQYVTLDTARAWYCAAGTADQPRVFGVRGFFSEISKDSSGTPGNASLRLFEVTDAANSEAYLKGFPQQIGMITAAFYRPVHKTKLSASPFPRYGTKLGELASENVEVYSGQEALGELIAAVTIRYGEVNQTPIPTVTSNDQTSCLRPFQN